MIFFVYLALFRKEELGQQKKRERAEGGREEEGRKGRRTEGGWRERGKKGGRKYNPLDHL